MAKRHATLRIGEAWRQLWAALPRSDDEKEADLGRQALELGLVLVALTRNHPLPADVTERTLSPVLPYILRWAQQQGFVSTTVSDAPPALPEPRGDVETTIDVRQMEQAADDLARFFADDDD